MPRRSLRTLARPFAASEPALETVDPPELARSHSGDETADPAQGAPVEVEGSERRSAASDPSRRHPAPVEGEDALEEPDWRKEYESPDALYARFRDVDYLRGRLANEVGALRRQIGLAERIIALLATSTDPFERRALLQASGLIREPKAHASIEEMIEVGEEAHKEAVARARLEAAHAEQAYEGTGRAT